MKSAVTKRQRAAKSGDKDAINELQLLDKIQPILEEGRPARSADLTTDERAIVKSWFLLTTKPTIYAANVDEATLADSNANAHVVAVQRHAASENSESVIICAQLEAELVALDTAERAEYLVDLGLTSSGVDKMIKFAYKMLGLMSFLTAGEKEVRAWTIPVGTKAPRPRAKFTPTSNAALSAPRSSVTTTCSPVAHAKPPAKRASPA